jgi:hypothetical protein
MLLAPFGCPLVIHNQLVATVLEPNKLEYCGGNDQRAGDEVGHDLIDNLVSGQIVRIAILSTFQF